MTAYSRANEIVRIPPFENTDAEKFVAAAPESMDTVGKWMDSRRVDYSLDEAQTWIESCQQYFADGIAYEFALVDPKTGKIFGGVGINQINTAYNFANIGYWVRRSREGRGLATAALQLLTEFAFKELKLTRVELVIRLDNLPSGRVAEKVGATFELIARNRIMLYGKALEGAIYSIVPEPQ